MRSPLRYLVYDYLRNEKKATDDEILENLNKETLVSKNELNKALMQLEILGIVSVRWVGKDKRRVELLEPGDSQRKIPGEGE